ncbi:MFS transporter [Amycolatopsis sp. CA-128772]|uniref:MFS transporter n=1 Tax=Amycolatopsis sp. CA-128772 TaxID=2073159 RepID=UPI000CD1A32E|nr:MFS transporter [Amycolatopsis sp. CA-128772]
MSVTYRQVFQIGEFRALFSSMIVSVAGDQFARVALSLLVFDRTGSAGWTAATYALTYLPSVLAGPLLSGLADRWPRRRVMIIADLLRAALVALMAIPGLALPVVAGLLVLVQAAGAPGNAARAATAAAALPGEQYVLGKGVLDTIVQLAQVLGFATGGTLVAGAGPATALLADAGSFLVSAAVIRLGVHERPAPNPAETGATVGAGGLVRWRRDLVDGSRLVARTPRLRALVALAAVAGFYVTVEGLAAPYAAQIGGSADAVGVLLAASPAGAVLGMALISRLRPQLRSQLLGPLAMAACVPLVLCLSRPGLMVTVVLWLLSGAASAYHLPASAEFTLTVPDQHRAQAYGLAATVLMTSQGLGIALAGLAATVVAPSTALAGAGGLGVVAAGLAGAAWNRARRAAPAE